MRETVRKRILRLTVTFTPDDPDIAGLEPTSAQATVYYKRKSDGAQTATTFALTKQADGAWSGIWDSKVAAAGDVKWSAESFGPVVAAVDGQFTLRANEANLAT